MITNPLDLRAHSKAHMIEQLMALVGRSRENPREYRQRLERLDDYELSQFYKKVMESI